MYPPIKKEEEIFVNSLEEIPVPEEVDARETRPGYENVRPATDVSRLSRGVVEAIPHLAFGLAKTAITNPFAAANEMAMNVAGSMGRAPEGERGSELGWSLLEQNPIVPISRELFSGDPETFAYELGKTLPGIALAGTPFARGKIKPGPQKLLRGGQEMLPEGRGPSVMEGEIVGEKIPPIRQEPTPRVPEPPIVEEGRRVAGQYDYPITPDKLGPRSDLAGEATIIPELSSNQDIIIANPTQVNINRAVEMGYTPVGMTPQGFKLSLGRPVATREAAPDIPVAGEGGQLARQTPHTIEGEVVQGEIVPPIQRQQPNLSQLPLIMNADGTFTNKETGEVVDREGRTIGDTELDLQGGEQAPSGPRQPLDFNSPAGEVTRFSNDMLRGMSEEEVAVQEAVPEDVRAKMEAERKANLGPLPEGMIENIYTNRMDTLTPDWRRNMIEGQGQQKEITLEIPPREGPTAPVPVIPSFQTRRSGAPRDIRPFAEPTEAPVIPESDPDVSFAKAQHPTAERWRAIVAELDAENAPDSAYRDILSTGSKDKLKKGETWRSRVLGYADSLDSRYEPPDKDYGASFARQDDEIPPLRRELDRGQILTDAWANIAHKGSERGFLEIENEFSEDVRKFHKGQLRNTDPNASFARQEGPNSTEQLQRRRAIIDAEILGIDHTRYDNLEQLQRDINREAAKYMMETGKNPLSEYDLPGSAPSSLKPGLDRGERSGERPNLDVYDKRNVSYAQIDEEHGKMSIGDEREMIEIFRNTYRGHTPQVATKELLQNAIDAAADVPNGHVEIEVDDRNSLVKVSDNGSGLKKALIFKEYSNLSASGKRGSGKNTIGEMGVGKTTYLITGKDVQVETVVIEDDGRLMLHSFGGDPETILTKFKVHSRPVPEGTQTGTTVTFTARPGSNFQSLKTYLNHFNKYSETKVPVKITGETIYRYNDSQGNAQEYPERLNINKAVTPRAGGRIVLEKEIPGTKYKLTIPDDAAWSFDQSDIALILNGRGMFQGVDSVWFGPHELPDRMIVDLEPTVPATDETYPLTAPTRENLMDAVKGDIQREIQRLLVDDAEAARKAKFLSLFDAIQPEHGASFVIYDAGKRLTPQEKMDFSTSPLMEGLYNVYNLMVEKLIVHFPEAIRSRYATSDNIIKHLGFIFEDKLLGVNIKRPDSNDHVMMINPFAAGSPSSTVRQAAQEMVHIIIHEFDHMIQRSEGANFTTQLAKIYKVFNLEDQINARNEIEQLIGEKQLFGGSGYNREFQRLLQQYTDSRGRAESEKDILLREAGSGASDGGGERYVSLSRATDGGGTSRRKRNQLLPEEDLEYARRRIPIILRKEKLTASDLKELGRLYNNYPELKTSIPPTGVNVGAGGASIPPTPPPRPPTGSSTIPPPQGGGRNIPTGGAGKPPKPLQKSSNLLELWNLSRGLKTIWDFSAPLRQGLGLIHKKEFWTSLDDMFAAFGSEQAYQAIMNEILSRPNFIPQKGQAGSFAKRSGLDLSDLMSRREENLVSKWAGKFPGGRRSNRAYTAFLNRLRADVFDSLIKDNPQARTNPVLAEGLADFVNMASGRGSLGKLEPAGHILNQFIFSPKLIASRLQILNPHYYITAHPKVRMEALKSLAAITATGLTVATLCKLMGADVSLDPTSSDFGKIKMGNIRLDPWGGHQQYIVAFARMSRAFNRQVLDGKRPKFNQSMFDVGDRFRRFKMHPSWGFAEDMARGTDFKGDRPQYPQAVIDLFTPMIAEDMMKLYQEDPRAVGLIVPEAFGMGVNVQED